MKLKLSKEIERTLILKKQIVEYFSKNSINPQEIASYCSLMGMPIIPTYYFLINELGLVELTQHLERLCKFYNIEVDI